MIGLSGCSGSADGHAGATATPSSPASAAPASQGAAQVPGPGVPKVETPIDTARFRAAPCGSLTPAQAENLVGAGIVPRPDLNAPAGPSCAWHSQAHVIVTFSNVDNLGLTSYYRAKGTVYPFFMPLDPIGGYPIVAYGQIDLRASKAQCEVALGTSDRDTVAVSVTQSPQNRGANGDACESAHQVAGLVLSNLKGGR
nr:DUF3558 domain-containing protein [Amycolatopsis rubida]